MPQIWHRNILAHPQWQNLQRQTLCVSKSVAYLVKRRQIRGKHCKTSAEVTGL